VILLQARKFFCVGDTCRRKIFTKPLPGTVVAFLIMWHTAELIIWRNGLRIGAKMSVACRFLQISALQTLLAISEGTLGTIVCQIIRTRMCQIISKTTLLNSYDSGFGPLDDVGRQKGCKVWIARLSGARLLAGLPCHLSCVPTNSAILLWFNFGGMSDFGILKSETAGSPAANSRITQSSSSSGRFSTWAFLIIFPWAS
jgi:hypothetical protein